MASSPTDPCTKEMANYARLCLVLLNVGCQVFREVFNRIHHPTKLQAVLSSYIVHSFLESLYKGKTKILNSTQWGNLYPNDPSSVSSNNFDITLLTLLLENICNLSPPATGWDNVPPVEEQSIEADIIRVRYLRYLVYGNGMITSANDTMFSIYWQKIRDTLVRLGGVSYGATIDKIKTVTMDSVFQEQLRELLKQWKEDEENIREGMRQMQRKGESSSAATTYRQESEVQGKNVIQNVHQIRYDADKVLDETRLLEDFNKIVSDKGFTISENPASGNCMFYALTEQLKYAKRIDISHEKLRTTLVQFLRENRNLPDGTDLFSFVSGYPTWSNYLRSMEKDGTWGDHLILHAAANYYKTCIRIISSLGNELVLYPDGIVLNPNPLVLGHVHEYHYVSLLPKQADKAKSTDYKDNISLENQHRVAVKKGTAPMTGQDDNTCKVPPQLSGNLPNCSDVNAPSKEWSEVPLPIDILLLTVKDCEFLSCYSHLQNCFKSYLKELGYVFFGEIGKLKVALSKHQEGSTGPGGSIIAAKDAITRLRPKAVFSVGTCSALSPAKANLGDVVISSKLVTYAHKTITEEGVQDRGIKAPVSRDFSLLIAHAADGWKAPLRDQNKHEVKVHRDCVMLSGPELVSAKKRCEELIRTYPDATAIEMDGEGLYTAAYDLKMEWVVIKGISGYADGTTTSEEKWEKFASVMAASIVANILRDSSVFQDWHHYGHEDGYNPTGLIDAIRRQYISREGTLTPSPWYEDFNFSLNDIFTRLKIVSREKTRSLLTDDIVNMTAIFRRHDECEKPRTVLIEGKPGMGKTTYSQKLAYDWATGKQKPGDCFPDFKVLLLLKCRDVIKGHDLWKTIADQLLPQGNTYKETREKFFKYIRDNQSKVLLVLDGLDELPKSKRAIFREIIKGRELPNCHIVATARHGTAIRKHYDTLLEIVGFIPDDIRKFIERYFKKTDGELGHELIDRLFTDAENETQTLVYRSLIEMMANPLNAALVCFVWEDLKSELPRLTETTLFVNIVECVLRRFVQRKGLSSNSDNFIDIYKVQLKHLGSIALNKLKKDCLEFEESALGPDAGVISEFGFLSVQTGSSKIRPRTHYGFQHKTFQEFFAAFYLSCQILDGNINLETLVNDIRYFNELKQVFLFSVGLIATKCKETALRLVKSILSEIGRSQAREEQEHETNEKRITCALECLGDLTYEETNFQNLLENYSSNSVSGLFAEALNTLTRLDLSPVNVGAVGAHVLSEALKVNTTLYLLNLDGNNIGKAGECALAESLKFNTTLTELILSCNNIGDGGAFAFAESLKVNTSLTLLDLSYNNIGEGGGCALAESLKDNTSLTFLDLTDNNIGEAGGSALAELLKVNTSLTLLQLSNSGIGDAGGRALAESLKVNTSLTSLQLPNSGIGEAGGRALAESLKVNTSLTSFGLCGNNIGDAGGCALVESLKVNTSLTSLGLGEIGIGKAGVCALAESLKFNITLTELYLPCNNIGDGGAFAFAESLKVNTSLTTLVLVNNNIGEAGGCALAESLKVNTSLTTLRLYNNNIGEAGRCAFAETLKVNNNLKASI